MTDWLPIETAPRDGTPILVFDPAADFAWNGLYSVSMVAWLDDGEGRGRPKLFVWAVPGSWQDEQGGYYIVDNPTHWMPLPSHPSPNKEG